MRLDENALFSAAAEANQPGSSLTERPIGKFFNFFSVWPNKPLQWQFIAPGPSDLKI